MPNLTESSIRSRAARQGYRLTKSRSRTDWDAGTFALAEADTGATMLPVAGSHYGCSLADVHEFLEQRSADA